MSQLQSTNIEYCRCCRSYLEELLQKKDYQGAVRYYESIKPELDGIPEPLVGIILRLAARAYTYAGAPKRALPLVRTAVHNLSKTVDYRKDLAQAFLVLGDTLRELGEFKEASRSFRDAESISRRSEDFHGAADALNRLAGIFFRESNFEQALQCMLDAMESIRQTDDRKKLSFMFGNIGRIYTMLGKLSSAEEYIRMNIDLASEYNEHQDMVRARLSLAYLYIQQARYGKADELLESTLTEIRCRGYINEEIIHLTYAGELAVRTGQFEAAVSLLTEAAARARKTSSNSLHAARPLRWLAELMVRQENYRRALTYLNQAMPIMKSLDDRIEIGALTRLKAICFEKLGKTEEARTLFLEACAMLEGLHARVELADCMVQMSESGVFTPAQRSMYHCRVEDIFRICRIERKLDRPVGIEREIMPQQSASPASENTGMFNSHSISRNPEMEKIIRQLNLLRTTDIPILFTGETGTGKDFLARYFHSIARPGRPYIAVNCAAIPDTLIEAELFGHNKGAFTGADTNRRGLFEAANGGVILLDEIGELPLPLQAKLLQVLESRKLRPLGGAKEIDLDIIVLAATNRDLEAMSREGTFRLDLYYRLAGITISIPPLRERKEDIPFLLERFMRQYKILTNGKGPDPDLVRLFVAYDWPGNVRQLENRVHQLKALTNLVQDRDFATAAQSLFDEKAEEPGQSLQQQLEKLEKKLLLEALVSANGNKSEAARLLSIHESTFRAKMKRFRLESAVN